MFKGRAIAVGASALAVAGLTSGVLSSGVFAKPDKRAKTARATLVDAKGKQVGSVRFEQRRGAKAVEVSVSARRLPPGFHGFHIHGMAHCEHPDFSSAGGHMNPGDAKHPDHAGDMPALLVNKSGRARMSFETDRFTIAQLRDKDGSAVMVHAKPDNYANIPADRYDPDPDAMTLDTGDAGPRIACGKVR